MPWGLYIWGALHPGLLGGVGYYLDLAWDFQGGGELLIIWIRWFNEAPDCEKLSKLLHEVQQLKSDEPRFPPFNIRETI